MALLTTTPLSPALSRAMRAQANVRGLRSSIVGGLRHAITDLWGNDYPSNVETAAALGANGAELYRLYQAFFAAVRALLEASGDSASVAELDALAARVPALTANADGTLTITAPGQPG